MMLRFCDTKPAIDPRALVCGHRPEGCHCTDQGHLSTQFHPSVENGFNVCGCQSTFIIEIHEHGGVERCSTLIRQHKKCCGWIAEITPPFMLAQLNKYIRSRDGAKVFVHSYTSKLTSSAVINYVKCGRCPSCPPPPPPPPVASDSIFCVTTASTVLCLCNSSSNLSHQHLLGAHNHSLP